MNPEIPPEVLCHKGMSQAVREETRRKRLKWRIMYDKDTFRYNDKGELKKDRQDEIENTN